MDCANKASADSVMPDARSERANIVDRLLEIWSRVLQVSPVFPESDFFDLGGDSLLAVGLLLEIEQETGVSIPVTAIYDAPTVAALAAMLDEQTKPKFSPLVCLQNRGDGAPLFVVHGIGGTVIELSRLGKEIRGNGPVYAVQAKGLDGREEPLTTVEGMADYYLAAIREIQPEGPYLLSGYSFGGLVAVEMARRLKQQQQDIGLLLLIDAYAHPHTWPLRTRVSVLARRLMDRGAELRRQPWRATIQYGVQKCRNFVRHRTRAQSGATPGKTVRRWLRQLTINLPPELRRVYSASEEALDTYVPRFYPGKITFLKAETPDTVFPSNPLPIWAPLAEEFELHSVPGDHLRLVTQHAESTAARVSACMAQGRASSGVAQTSSRGRGSLRGLASPIGESC
jgi:acetoacetyl-CoA synthetase